MSDAAAECLTQADSLLSDATPFVLDRPGIFPLASDVLRQARAWAANGVPARPLRLSDSRLRGHCQQASKGKPKAEATDCGADRQPARSTFKGRRRDRRAAVFATGVGGLPSCPGSNDSPGSSTEHLSSSRFQPPCAATGRPKDESARAPRPPPSASKCPAGCCTGPDRGRACGFYWFRRQCRRSADPCRGLQCFLGRGYASTIQSPECSGQPACPVAGPPGRRPFFGTRLRLLDPRHFSSAENASGAPSEGRFFCKAPPANSLAAHIPDIGRACRSRPHDPLLRKVRRLWKPKAARPLPVPAGPSQRLAGSRIPERGSRPGGTAYHYGRPSQRRWWQARPGVSLQSAAGSSGLGVCEPPFAAHRRAQTVLATRGRPACGLDLGICQRTGDPVKQTPRVRGPPKEAKCSALSCEGAAFGAYPDRSECRACPHEEADACKGVGEPPGLRGELMLLRSPSSVSSSARPGLEGGASLVRYKALRCAEQLPVPSFGQICAPGVVCNTGPCVPEAAASSSNLVHSSGEAAPLISRCPCPSAPGVSRGLLVPPGLQSPSGPAFSEPDGHQTKPPGFPAGTFDMKTDFWAWAAALPRLLLATNTSFSRFLAGSFSLRPGTVTCQPTALYPLPIPKAGLFDAGKDPEAMLRSPGSRRELLLDRVLRIVVMGLNFLHSNFRHVPHHVLQRLPSSCQLQVFDRIRVMLRACARSCGPADCAPLCFGRRGVHLVARLSELSEHLANLGLGHSAYLGEPPGGEVPHCSGGPDALRPYRDTDPSRILITGRGNWNLDRRLEWDPELHVPFREPAVLRAIPPNDLPFPSASLDKKSATLELMKLWSAKGLLRVFPGPAADRELCRTFGSFKNEHADRMIGDRRGPNSLEGRVVGPSRRLPPGQLLVNISVPRYSHVVVGASTDRSDFYHQIRATTPRAQTNRVGPSLSAFDIKSAGLGKYIPKVPRTLLTDPSGPHCHGAFSALFQGDHGGVEYATAGHESLLLEAGLLDEGSRLSGRSPVPLGDFWEGLIIDDFYASFM